jgi:hypothetical protein
MHETSKIFVQFLKTLYDPRAGISPKVFCQKILAISSIFGDIGTRIHLAKKREIALVFWRFMKIRQYWAGDIGPLY